MDEISIRVLFVCLGNICRSPLAEAVFRDVVKQRGIESYFVIDSAGTGSWHVGHEPDARMSSMAEEHGISMSDMYARQFTAEDFKDYDHIFAMDRENLNDILYLDHDTGSADPGTTHDAEEDKPFKVRLFREADPDPGNFQVPDPYYGGGGGFQEVFEIVKRTSEALVDAFVSEYDLVRD